MICLPGKSLAAYAGHLPGIFKKGTLGFFCFVAGSNLFSQQELLLQGTYYGKNVFIQNPTTEGLGFCVTEVIVNSTSIPVESSSAFEIDFTPFNFAMGDSVTIVIRHKSDCKPKVINPGHPLQESTFKIKEIKITDEGKLTWKTTNEKTKLDYIIEQYRWNKWVKIGEVEGGGSMDENSYSFDVVPHSGENQIRVKQVDHTNTPRISDAVRFTPETKPVEIVSIDKKTRQIVFSDSTLFELYDQNGNMIKRGFGKAIDCSECRGKIFFLNFDNTSTKIVLRKKST